jgi:hypothetical protein
MEVNIDIECMGEGFGLVTGLNWLRKRVQIPVAELCLNLIG